MENFPEIVYILEGAIYESGIFLQYELAKLLKENNVENIILGECADQVLNYELYNFLLSTYKKLLHYFKKVMKRILYGIECKPYKDVYEMASYKILKKNGIMLNYYNINPEYPYLRNEFINIARNVVKLTDKEKEYHKYVINSILPKKVTQYLKKIGGATDLKSLFTGDINLDNLKKECINSRFYVDKKFDDEFYEIDYFMKVIYLMLFEKIFFKSKPNNFISSGIFKYDLKYFFPNLSQNKDLKELKHEKSNILNK